MNRCLIVIACLFCSVTLLANEPPVLEDIPEQITREGFSFGAIQLLSFASDADHSFSELIWTVEGSEHILPALAGSRIFVSVSDSEWSGTEVVRIEVCDPAGACASQDIVFTVTPVNDPPVLSMNDQIVNAMESFETILISEIVTDIDHDLVDLTWTIESTRDVQIVLNEGALIVVPPSAEWIGVETVTITVCDPEGACDRREIQVARIVPEMLAITRVSTTGGLICVGDTTIAIDALATHGVRSETLTLLQTATPPYDPDVILVTHDRYDHYDARTIATHMLANEKAILIGPQSVIETVRGVEPSLADGRLVPIELGTGQSTILEIAGAVIEVVDYPYIPENGPHNLGYIVDIGGYTVLHTGDLVLAAWDDLVNHALAARTFDVALIPNYVTADRRWDAYVQSIRADVLINTHVAEHELLLRCEAMSCVFETVRRFSTPDQTLFFDLK